MAKPKLLVTAINISQAIRIKAIGYVYMRPFDFIMLTTKLSPATWIKREDQAGRIHTVDQYNDWQTSGHSHSMPWLDLSWNSSTEGKIVGHEGRHRAAALTLQGQRFDYVLPVAIRLCSTGKVAENSVFDSTGREHHLTEDDVPTTWTGQFDSYSDDIKYRDFSSFHRDTALHVVESRLAEYA